jgi:hypothetical protein
LGISDRGAAIDAETRDHHVLDLIGAMAVPYRLEDQCRLFAQGKEHAVHTVESEAIIEKHER